MKNPEAVFALVFSKH